MNQATSKESKEQIVTAFSKLLAEYKKSESKIATKEEEAEKEKNQQLLENVSTYTIDNIVNGMASLQLEFGRIINEVSQNLTEESEKLDQLKRSIAVEKEHLQQLCQVRLVADALYILRQEHQEKLRILQNQTTTQQESIAKETEQTRKAWLKEQQDFDTRVAEQAELNTKQKEKEVADFQYEIEQLRKIEMDEYEEAKRLQERELMQAERQKEKDWQEREKVLTDKQAEFAANQKKVEGFEEALKKAYNDAKGEAIKDATKEAEIKANLLEKEWESSKQGYELRIQSLDATIQRQTEQISELTSQLQAVTTQAQNLAMRAFQTATNSAS